MATGTKRYAAEEVVNKLRQADVELAKGRTVAVMVRSLTFVPALALGAFGGVSLTTHTGAT